MRRATLLVTLTATLILAAACGGSVGDILGGILGSPSSDQPSDVRGTVTNIDTNARRIDLDVGYINNLRDNRQGQSIYYDSNTRVEFNNQTYRPEDLERGDEISIRGVNDNGRYVAQTITVTRNVRQ